jgi:hypothetical protein
VDILIVQVFVSLLLVVGGVVALAYSIKSGDPEHADRLSILPLSDDNNEVSRENRGATNDHV